MIDSRQQLGRGLVWLGSAEGAVQVLDLVGSLAVIALLTPEQVGLAALAWSFGSVAEAFAGLGTGFAIVQRPRLSRTQLDSTFWFALSTGVLLALGVALLGAPLSWLFGAPELRWLMLGWSPKLIVVALVLVPLDLLRRRLRFREVSAVRTVASVASNATKVLLAWLGAGAWAPVMGNAAHAVYVLAALAIFAPYRPRWRCRPRSIRGIVRFGVRTSAAKAVYHLYSNVDYMLVGRWLGLEALGVYRVGFQFAMSPVETISAVANRVSFSVMSRVADEAAELHRAFADAARILLVAAGLVATFLWLNAAEVLALLTVPRWAAAAGVVAILAWAGVMRAFARLFPVLFQAAGRPELAVTDSIVSMIVLVLGFAAALATLADRFGVIAIAVGWVCAYPLILLFLVWLARREVGLSVRQLGSSLAPVVPLLAVAGTAMIAVRRWAPFGPAPLAVCLSVGTTGALAYLVARRLWGPAKTQPETHSSR